MNPSNTNPKIVAAVSIAFLGYALYSWYSIPTDEGFFNINSQKYKSFNALHQPPFPKERHTIPPPEVAPSGPSAPAERAPNVAVIVPPEEPYDPQEQPQESSDHPNRLRYPERLYGPGLDQDSNEVNAVGSGIASNSHQATMNAYQVFSPEFAQNGGLFMDNGVMANDTAVKLEYSSV
jgi:hypothetical protein